MRQFSVAILGALLFASVFWSSAFSQSAISGTWTIQPGRRAGEVQLELRYRRANEPEHVQDMHDFTAQSLGLTSADLSSPSHPVHFALRRDAGAFDFTGTVGDGVGAGHYTFSPSAAYADAIAGRGLERPSADEQVAAALLDISLAYTDGIIGSGLRPSSFQKLIAFRALQVTPESVSALRRAFGSLNGQGIITFTALHITPEYASEMRSLGIADLDQQSLVTLKALHVDAAYVHDLASLGYTHLSAHDLTQLKALHIDGDYIRRVQSHGYKHPSIPQLVQLKALNII